VIEDSLHDAIAVLPDVVNGDWQKAMNRLHAPAGDADVEEKS
jgi:hypothetical protein